jgi:uncharacterized DUF497 family protein
MFTHRRAKCPTRNSARPITVTREDIRERYGERRYVTFGILNGEVVVLVHTDRDGDTHVISLRRAEKYEARYYIETAKAYLA